MLLGVAEEVVVSKEGGNCFTMTTVGILADLDEGVGGGVNQFTSSLVRSLLEGPEDDQRYVLFLSSENLGWLDPVPSHVRVVPVPRQTIPRGWTRWRALGRRYGEAFSQLCKGSIRDARIAIAHLFRQHAILTAYAQTPWKLDVIHFPFQDFAPVDVPFLFSPWDLQHRHLKDFWPKRVVRARDAYYWRGCELADWVMLGSEWAREDVIQQYGIPRSKTSCVRIAAPTHFARQASAEFGKAVQHKYQLPQRFSFYPAVTWKHKNHIGLLSAFAKVVRTTEPDLHLVCCGQNGRNFDEIMAHAADLGISDQVHFLGYVDDRDVRALYRLAEFCVMPSLFEGAGMVVLEALAEGCPLAASDVTCIKEYAGDAAVLFNPFEIDSMAEGIAKLASSKDLRRDLAKRGRERATLYSWEKVAAEHVSLYKRLAAGTGNRTNGRH